jgi:hypothetical protein
LRANTGQLVTKLLQTQRRVTLGHAQDGKEEVPSAYLSMLEIACLDESRLDDPLGDRRALSYLGDCRGCDGVTQLRYREPHAVQDSRSGTTLGFEQSQENVSAADRFVVRPRGFSIRQSHREASVLGEAVRCAHAKTPNG